MKEDGKQSEQKLNLNLDTESLHALFRVNLENGDDFPYEILHDTDIAEAQYTQFLKHLDDDAQCETNEMVKVMTAIYETQGYINGFRACAKLAKLYEEKRASLNQEFIDWAECLFSDWGE